LFWQWMRLPGDVVFAAGALLMAWDFFVKGKALASRSPSAEDVPAASPAE